MIGLKAFGSQHSPNRHVAPFCGGGPRARHLEVTQRILFKFRCPGPYILPDRLTGPRYLIFLEQVLPELLDSAHVTAATRTSMWFQQDGAPAHFSISVRNHLNETCGER
ncbi:uncharacterized protein TNCV_531651 [Trichonephila clavipes]|nr:uncharacterized protein TNCV_531651 [Trichonephila clavipes]